MSAPIGMPESWTPTPAPDLFLAQIALAAIYLASAVVESVLRRQTLGLSEILRASLSLAAGIGGAIWVFHTHRPLMYLLGIAALAAGIACYALSFRLFERDNKWNFRAWATFGLLLVVVGLALPFSQQGFWALCGLASVICCWTARRFRLPTLAVHGAIFYAIAAFVARITSGFFEVFFSANPAPVELGTSVFVLAIGLAAWTSLARISASQRDQWRNQLSSALIAALIIWISAGLLASIPGAAPVGTLILSSAAIVLAWSGRRWNRPEFRWIVYLLLSLGACKLATRDFQQDHNLALVISLVSYGGALIILPKIAARTASDSV
jgi:hypothetical protein